MASQPGFFDLEERYSALSKANDPLKLTCPPLTPYPK
jgi:hypothetical protein